MQVAVHHNDQVIEVFACREADGAERFWLAIAEEGPSAMLWPEPDSVRPWHYAPVLAREPGALRNGAPFKDWLLPAGLERVRRKLAGSAAGDRQMAEILTAVLSDRLPVVEAAGLEALREGVHSADLVLDILARQRAGG